MPYSDEEVRARIASYQDWYHSIELRPGIVTPGRHLSPYHLELLNLPQDCRGLRALDLGTRDGFYAFELERRGAEVMALDYHPAHETGFAIAADILQSQVEYVQDNVYNVSSEKYGEFDLVLCLGLLYHLPDPLLVLNNIRSVCTDLFYLESHVIDHCFLLSGGKRVSLKSVSRKLLDVPIMQYYPGQTLNNDPTNFWGANTKCLEQMLLESDFEVLSSELDNTRAVFRCRTAEQSRHRGHAEIGRGVVALGV